ncbi:hypothetical protein SZ00_04398 [Rhodococcus sp. AD45]|nr:hypothetical protein SZ00_04398 [Rhodococcus sp. AD45]
MDEFEGKVALIAGATRDQGRPHAVSFAEEVPTSSLSIGAKTLRPSRTRWQQSRTSTDTINPAPESWLEIE